MRIARLEEHARARARAQLGRRRNIRIGRGVRLGPNVRLTAATGARIVIGDDVEIGGGTTLSAGPGASLVVNREVFISGWCIIAAVQSIEIGAGSMIAEVVSIRDHDHDVAYPPREGRLVSHPVHIGQRVWVGAKATIVRGGGIGDDSVVGANALVNQLVPADSLAVGVPAVVKRSGIRITQVTPPLPDLTAKPRRRRV